MSDQFPTAAPIDEAHVRVRRVPERGTRDHAVITSILDAGISCHLGIVQDDRPVVIPTLYGRDGDRIVLHGSAAARSLRVGAAGLPVCVTVTIIDGLVLARSGFHHSANYRSVMVHGEAQPVVGDDAKLAALEVLTEHVAPGRWVHVRQPDAKELKATTVLTLSLEHAAAKVRSGGVVDDSADLDWPVWAGVVPVSTSLGEPIPDEGLASRLTPPAWTGASGAPAAPDDVARTRGSG